ncbi:hypothetical protein ANO11243_091040 [Dothideomycetidae sp. 11243]|nr:hypothetical protein ANO11243_091040 [fungal sp. No.11243]
MVSALPQPTKEGTIPFKISSIEKPCFTAYKILGDLQPGVPPVIGLHGGPGFAHNHMLGYAELWPRYELPLILYDQIGCGQSTHLQEKAGDEGFWQESLFIDELENLLRHFGRDNAQGSGYHLLGWSWGGMLGSAFAAQRPPGLRRLILASGLASRELSTKGLHLLREHVPEDIQAAIDEAIKTKDFDSKAYKEAFVRFVSVCACKMPTLPEPMVQSLMGMQQDDTVYKTMMGPSVFLSVGSLADWTVVPRLHRIDVPTLVFNGEFDTSHDVAQIPFFEHIPRVRWVTIAGASHSCIYEKPEQTLRLVGDFLTYKTSKEAV